MEIKVFFGDGKEKKKYTNSNIPILFGTFALLNIDEVNDKIIEQAESFPKDSKRPMQIDIELNDNECNTFDIDTQKENLEKITTYVNKRLSSWFENEWKNGRAI